MPVKAVVTLMSVILLVNVPSLLSVIAGSGRSIGPLHTISTELPTPPLTLQVKVTSKPGLSKCIWFIKGISKKGARKKIGLIITIIAIAIIYPPMLMEVDALSGIMSESVTVHVYSPQYPESRLVRRSRSVTRLPLTVWSNWLEMLADNAVVDQSIITVSGTLLKTAHCRIVVRPSSFEPSTLTNGPPVNVPIKF